LEPIKTVEEVREYTQKEYWEEGTISGYQNFHIDWTWNNKLIKCLEQSYDFKGKKILDLGCAYGQVVAAFHKAGYDAKGIDISDYAIEAGKKEYKPLEKRTRQGSIHDLSCYKNKSFDFLYSNQVFEHLPAQYCEALASETFRIAKPKSILWAGLVLDICAEFQPQGFNPADKDKTHINLRPKIWWDEIFVKAGWVIDEEFDKKFRASSTEGYSFFKEYGWHSICYKKA
jgi:ubiquinone/menaquinone biosynthesis C-methylase UbiE